MLELGWPRSRGRGGLWLVSLCLDSPQLRFLSAEHMDELGSESPEVLRSMLQWLEIGGASWSQGLRIREVSPGERGLVTLQNRRAWQRDLLQVPAGRMFSAAACDSNASSFVSRLPPHLHQRLISSHALLHLCFLEHRLILGSTSPFAPYLRTLPSSLAHLPLLAADGVVNLLAGSPLHGEILKHRKDLRDLYDDIAWELSDFSGLITFDDFLLTYCMVESHSHARHEGNDTMPLMVPLVDLVNHRSDGTEQLRLGWTDAGGTLAVHVGRNAVAVEEQVFFRYSSDGELSQKFFKQFGFVDDNLPIGAKVAFPLQRQHPNYLEKRLLFDEGLVQAKTMMERIEGLDGSQYVDADSKIYDFPKFVIWRCDSASRNFTALHPETVEQDLLPFARFVMLEGGLEAVQRRCDSSHKPPSCNSRFSSEEDATATAYLLDHVQRHLEVYHETPDEDDRLLGMPFRPETPYIRIRRDEKRCLLALQDEIHTKLGHFIAAATTRPLVETSRISEPQAGAASEPSWKLFENTKAVLFGYIFVASCAVAIPAYVRRVKASRYRE